METGVKDMAWAGIIEGIQVLFVTEARKHYLLRSLCLIRMCLCHTCKQMIAAGCRSSEGR
jgi:hypothetical protein